jgi:hypothetical protein
MQVILLGCPSNLRGAEPYTGSAHSGVMLDLVGLDNL